MQPDTATGAPPLSSSPPGPRGYPVVGVLPKLFRDPLNFLVRSAEEYGPIVRMGFGSRQFYLVSDPDAIQHILQDNSQNYWKGQGMDVTRPLMGNGLAVSEGDFWRQQRRLMQPAFTQARLLEEVPTMLASVESLLDDWKRRKSRVELNVVEVMNDLTQELIVKTLFRADLGDQAPVFARACTAAQEYINYRAWAPFALPLRVPTPRNVRFKRALAALDRVIYGVIDERAASPLGDDLLSSLLKAKSESGSSEADAESANRQQIRDEMVTLLFAGHETTAAALVWTLYLLSQNPQEYDRVAQEAEQVFGAGSPRNIERDALAYTRLVVRESMRLYPPGWVLVRTSREADEVCGYTLPPVATVLISPYVTHRQRQYWRDPETFAPQRFEPQESASLHRFAYLPYGGGPRLCIGHHLATLIVQLTIARICRDYRPELLPGQRVRIRPLTTLQPKGAVRMTMVRR